MSCSGFHVTGDGRPFIFDDVVQDLIMACVEI